MYAEDNYYEPTALWYFDEMRFLQDRESYAESVPSITIASTTDEDEEAINNESREDVAGLMRQASCNLNTTKRSTIGAAKKKHLTEQEKLSTIVCERQRQQSDNEYENLTKTWACELQKMNPMQQLFAKKAINDILLEGQLGNIQRNSVQINVQQQQQISTSSIPFILNDRTTPSHFSEHSHGTDYQIRNMSNAQQQQQQQIIIINEDEINAPYHWDRQPTDTDYQIMNMSNAQQQQQQQQQQIIIINGDEINAPYHWDRQPTDDQYMM